MAGFIVWVKNHREDIVVFSKICFFSYCLFLICVIIFKYPFDVLIKTLSEWNLDLIKEGVDTANLVPFRTIKMYVRYYDEIRGFDNLFGNVLLFLPFGILIKPAFPKINNVGYVILHSFWFSLGIELFQLVTHFGAFDVDDLILNCLGAMLGYLVYWILEKVVHFIIK